MKCSKHVTMNVSWRPKHVRNVICHKPHHLSFHHLSEKSHLACRERNTRHVRKSIQSSRVRISLKLCKSSEAWMSIWPYKLRRNVARRNKNMKKTNYSQTWNLKRSAKVNNLTSIESYDTCNKRRTTSNMCRNKYKIRRTMLSQVVIWLLKQGRLEWMKRRSRWTNSCWWIM